mmetsp:Transcript_3749/g.7847  ORF Transcript_3749/g.7847 Transcript_3749/m.7847 type:complete len:275 (-) Transcript_3749:60-884(-)
MSTSIEIIGSAGSQNSLVEETMSATIETMELDESHGPLDKYQHLEKSTGRLAAGSAIDVLPCANNAEILLEKNSIKDLPTEILFQVLGYLGSCSPSLAAVAQISKRHNKLMNEVSSSMMRKADFRIPLKRNPCESTTSKFVRHARACSDCKNMVDQVFSFTKKDFRKDVSIRELDEMTDVTMKLITAKASRALRKQALTYSGKFGGKLFKFAKETQDTVHFDRALVILQMVVLTDVQNKKKSGRTPIGAALCKNLLNFYMQQKNRTPGALNTIR